MKNNKITKFKEGKRIKKVTMLPNFLLRLKGKIDSKNNETVATAFCEKLCNRCRAIENQEIIFAEKGLHEVRCQAAKILADMTGNSLFLRNLPDAFEENSAIQIRANNRNKAARSSVSGELKDQLKSICEINEIIINTNSTLEQRIDKTRNLCLEKINCYVMGLRAGGKMDFTFDRVFENEAISTYFKKHEIGDSAICAKANVAFSIKDSEEDL